MPKKQPEYIHPVTGQRMTAKRWQDMKDFIKNMELRQQQQDRSYDRVRYVESKFDRPPPAI